jgi:hypothetical protein
MCQQQSPHLGHLGVSDAEKKKRLGRQKVQRKDGHGLFWLIYLPFRSWIWPLGA